MRSGGGARLLLGLGHAGEGLLGGNGSVNVSHLS
jgi:hypothetical protein